MSQSAEVSIIYGNTFIVETLATSIKDAYNRYKNATAAAKGERRKAILKALEDLPKFFNDLEKIETGQNYTYEQERDAVQELRSTLDARDRRVVDFLLHMYTSRLSYIGRTKKNFYDNFLGDVRNEEFVN
ncbi:hypothetical protein Y032_0264g618 [Ancylostoma ceylanicum]|uniref:SXP/RAL-2 family protein Ani s 5-like cation-binding domain-containing protein n=1 Tax=Ancylostoma ceylanicum TaxID=53326 RepID=A0A016S9K5_9BILA|nr:hypothetical protein Y032_0264g618 [Ancylostoma ceylanicum]